MIPKNRSRKSYRYGRSEGYESRFQHRLKNVLGVNQAAAEAILHLHSQVVELQAHIRKLEAELSAQHANQQIRLARFREVYDEATWIELEIQE
jgi:hypothetical protein